MPLLPQTFPGSAHPVLQALSSSARPALQALSSEKEKRLPLPVWAVPLPPPLAGGMSLLSPSPPAMLVPHPARPRFLAGFVRPCPLYEWPSAPQKPAAQEYPSLAGAQEPYSNDQAPTQ